MTIKGKNGQNSDSSVTIYTAFGPVEHITLSQLINSVPKSILPFKLKEIEVVYDTKLPIAKIGDDAVNLFSIDKVNFPVLTKSVRRLVYDKLMTYHSGTRYLDIEDMLSCLKEPTSIFCDYKYLTFKTKGEDVYVLIDISRFKLFYANNGANMERKMAFEPVAEYAVIAGYLGEY